MPQDQRGKQPANPNLGCWQKGQSGNPGGRPKGKSLLAEIREVLDGDTLAGKKTPGGMTVRRFLAERTIAHAVNGNAAFARLIYEYLFGKPLVRVEQKSIDGDADVVPDHVVAAGLKAMLEAAQEGEAER